MITQKYVDIQNGAVQPLVGYQTFAATTAATTVITVPTYSWWDGIISLSCSAGEVAAGTTAPQALVVISLSGAGSNPAAGNYMALQALSGANAATGLSGTGASTSLALPFLIATTANPVLVQATVTIAGTTGRCDVTASGRVF